REKILPGTAPGTCCGLSEIFPADVAAAWTGQRRRCRPAHAETDRAGEGQWRRSRFGGAVFRFWPLSVDLLVAPGRAAAQLAGNLGGRDPHTVDRRLASGCECADELLAGGSVRLVRPDAAALRADRFAAGTGRKNRQGLLWHPRLGGACHRE